MQEGVELARAVGGASKEPSQQMPRSLQMALFGRSGRFICPRRSGPVPRKPARTTALAAHSNGCLPGSSQTRKAKWSGKQDDPVTQELKSRKGSFDVFRRCFFSTLQRSQGVSLF